MNKPIRILVANRPKVMREALLDLLSDRSWIEVSERFPMTLIFLTLWTERCPICS